MSKNLCFAPDILRKSYTLQEFFETKKLEEQNINSRWEKRLREVKYYGFFSIVKRNLRIKVIVKEIQGGNKFFWSIVPFWKNKQKNSGSQGVKEKILHLGSMEDD